VSLVTFTLAARGSSSESFDNSTGCDHKMEQEEEWQNVAKKTLQIRTNDLLYICLRLLESLLQINSATSGPQHG